MLNETAAKSGGLQRRANKKNGFLNLTIYMNRAKNQPQKQRGWRFFLNFFLNRPENGEWSRAGVDAATAAPTLLRSLGAAPGVPAVCAVPDLNIADRIVADVETLTTELGRPLRILTLPEASRGKLLFPGGESRRARALNAALTGEFDLLIGSVHALLGPAPPPEESRDAMLELRPGMELSPSELAEKLVRLDYDDEYETTVSGEFSRRGGIVDLFSPAHDFPCRVEFFGDTIDSLRGFSPETQRSTGAVDAYRIIVRSGITAGGRAEGDVFDYFAGRDWNFIEFFPESARERLEKSASAPLIVRLDEIETERSGAGRRIVFYDAGSAAFHPELPLSELHPSGFAPTDGETPEELQRLDAPLKCRLLRNRIVSELAEGVHVTFLAEHAEDVDVLRRWARRSGFTDSAIEFDAAPLTAGFLISEAGLDLVTERELADAGFVRDELDAPQEAESAAEPPPEPARTPEFSLAELDEGDYAVHLDHGIGIFRGFRTLTSGGVSREVLELEYRDSQLLYVPFLQAHKVSRYLGAPGKVRLHALGGGRWKRDKENARQSVHSYAADMLRLQAMRQAIPGIRFPADTAGTRAFLRKFPFPDTPDQKRSTVEIAEDMESARPMDRLLCGDVGYGKTEIAMRAVFKAVSAGYQAAILAPTTVLAQQHYHTFRERFAEYPFTIDVLSRFRTAADQNRIIGQLRTGGVDIIIGTHRLCGTEIRFRNLGLVVIDEEQRFGVKHKERLRRFRAEVDVLTMSATPIPRTLYLAMAGARDLSTLMTPPKLRLPVKTVIAPEEDAQIAAAVNAELARGGQIYYLHNRVRTIEECADRLRCLVPGAKFAVAHGQMPEGELERVMTAFLERKIDCLVCSTIIESGLDVPNANTIIIERADRFGLAELYQLRGRVGRWTRQAYAYLLLPRSELVSSDARKRLAAIRRCSNLGAGFQLALRDLEIRGSGNLLGAEQSGHLNLIGFDLYCQLLKQEVGKLRGEHADFLPEVEPAIDFVSLTLNAPKGMIAAAIPPEYISETRLRLAAYRKLGSLTSETELDDFADELRDRYGKLPEITRNLLEVVRLRILAARGGYEIFTVIDGRVTLKNPGGTVYRIDGLQPTVDYRDPPELRMVHLRALLRAVPPRG